MPVHLEDALEFWGIEQLEPDAPPVVYAGQQGRLDEAQFHGLSEVVQILWTPGERHQMAMGVAGLLAKEGYLQSEAERLVARVCGATVDMEGRDRLQAVRDTYKRAAQGLPVVGWKAFSHRVGEGTSERLSSLLRQQSPPESDVANPYEDLFDLTVRQDFPAYEALIEGVLPSDPRGQVVYLAGLSQSFKSYLSLDFACHIAIGQDWQGRKVTKGETLYVVGEGTYEYIVSRLRAWEAEHRVRVEGIKCRLSPIPLMNREAVLRIIDRYERRMPGFKPRLVILDTLSQCAGSADENSSKDARTVYQNAKEFGKAWGSTVLIVCHRGKSDSNIMRGSSALFDDSDAVIEMVRPSWQSGGLDCTLNVKKLKMGKLLIGWEMNAREVEWDDGTRKGKDLVLVQRVFGRAALESRPCLEGLQMSEAVITTEVYADEACPNCGKPILRERSAEWVSLPFCSGYPECKIVLLPAGGADLPRSSYPRWAR